MALSTEGNCPCIICDSNHSGIDDDSVITFWMSFTGDSSRSLNSLLEDTDIFGQPEEVIQQSLQSPRTEILRMPRRRASIISDAGLRKPRRRSSKSTTSSSCDFRRNLSTDSTLKEYVRARMQREANDLEEEEAPAPITELSRQTSLERFQEEPKPRTSLGPPTLPLRREECKLEEEEAEEMPLPLTDLVRQVSMERFQENSPARVSLELPALPQRKGSILAISCEDDIACLLSMLDTEE